MGLSFQLVYVRLTLALSYKGLFLINIKLVCYYICMDFSDDRSTLVVFAILGVLVAEGKVICILYYDSLSLFPFVQELHGL